MADPLPYTVAYSFSGFQASNPTTPLPATKVDNEFANAAASIATLVSAIESVRRSDGALQNGIVTFDSFASGLQLTVDPTNGNLVAAAVAGTQANATASAASATAAAGSASSALTQANAAAASAATVNLALYLPKSGNLAGIGSASTARANISAANIDGSDMIGRLAPTVATNIADWNSVVTNGWFQAVGAANSPPGGNFWLAQVFSVGVFVAQIAYPYNVAGSGTSFVTPYRRHSYDSGGGILAWSMWQSASPVQVGSTIWINDTVAPPGFVKENGALLSRASFPALCAFALNSGMLTTEANWLAGNTGAFTPGDLSTTFRIPDTRGEFIRAYDDSRGVDSGRNIVTHQTADNAPHTHVPGGGIVGSNTATPVGVGTGASIGLQNPTSITISSQGTEGRPRNNAKLACIKY